MYCATAHNKNSTHLYQKDLFYEQARLATAILKLGKNSIIPCLQSSLGFAMYYPCSDRELAMPDWMASTYKES